MQTLTTKDNQTFILGGLSSITSAAGSYSLTLAAAAAGIVDLNGVALLANITESWTVAGAFKPGDADLDGDVDPNDVAIWAVNFTGDLPPGTGSKTWTQGDWDGDGDVDPNDVALWAVNFTGDLPPGGAQRLRSSSTHASLRAGCEAHAEHRSPAQGEADNSPTLSSGQTEGFARQDRPGRRSLLHREDRPTQTGSARLRNGSERERARLTVIESPNPRAPRPNLSKVAARGARCTIAASPLLRASPQAPRSVSIING